MIDCCVDYKENTIDKSVIFDGRTGGSNLV